MLRAFAVTLAALAAVLLAWRWLSTPPPPPPAPDVPSHHAPAPTPEQADVPAQTTARTEVADPGAASPAEPAPAPAPAAVRVRGVVVFPDHELVEGARVRLIAGVSGPSPVFREAVSDARGEFTLSMPARGECYLNVEGTGGLVEPRTTTLPATGGEHELRIVVERPDPATTITGVVVDERGAPCADANVSAIGEGFFGQSWTRADGTFAVARAAPRHVDGSAGVKISATVKDREQASPAPDERVRWGQQDVRIVVRPLPGTWLVVRDPSGAPVRAFDAMVLRPNSRWLDPVVHTARDAAEGRLRLEPLRAGHHVVYVRAAAGAGDWLAIGPVEFDVENGVAPEQVIAAAVPIAELRVTSQAAPAPAFVAELVRDLTAQPCTLRCIPVDFAVADRAALRRTSWFSMASAAAQDGTAVLRVPPGHYWLRVRGEHVLPQLIAVEVPAGMSSKALTFAVGGVLQGRLLPTDALPALWPAGAEAELAPKVLAQPRDGGPEPPPATVAADGTFSLGPLPAGPSQLTLEYFEATTPDARALTVILGERAVPAGQTHTAEFDVRACLPGSMTLHVHLDGTPYANAQLFLRRQMPAWNARATADERGRVDQRLPPGEYDVLLAIAAQPGPGWHMLPLPDRLQVVAGGTHEFTVLARTRTMRIRLVDGKGAPVANQRLQIEGLRQYFRVGGLSTDGDGRVEITPAPYGPFHLQLLGDGAAAKGPRAGPFELDAHQDRGEATFTIR